MYDDIGVSDLHKYFSATFCDSEYIIIIIMAENGSCLTWLATSLEEKRRWLIINASPRGQCSK